METKTNVDVFKTNKYLKSMENDYLYHLNMGTATHDFEKLFGDVRFVCMGGSNRRMEEFAKFIKEEIIHDREIEDYSSDRYAFYKIGPVLSISHGMGMPSMSILLHEIIKLMHYAKCQNPIFLRIGTCGGVGVNPGTVIITKEAYNGLLENFHEFVILGKRVKRRAKFDENLAKEILSCKIPDDKFEIIFANTMATDDFYEGQGRIDGAICYHTENDKNEYLKRLYEIGIRNIEMEATVFAAITNDIGIKAADICVALVNRMNGDQVLTPKEHIKEMEKRPQMIVGRFIKKNL